MRSQEMSIRKIAELGGTTPRTLRYYEKIGLLNPTRRSNLNYRIYSSEELFSLYEIFFYKEIGFSLAEIRKLLSAKIYSRDEILEGYLQILNLKTKQTERLIDLASDILSGDRSNDFSVFSNEELSSLCESYKNKFYHAGIIFLRINDRFWHYMRIVS